MIRFLEQLANARQSLWQAKFFSATTVLLLATVMAMLSTVTSLNTILLFKELPYPQAEQLLALQANIASPGQKLHGNTTALARQWHDSLASLGQFEMSLGSESKVSIAGSDEKIPSTFVSMGYFNLLGVKAAQGMTLSELDATEEKSRVAVLSHDLWQRLFPQGQSIATANINIEGQTYRVVGVMPADFRSPKGLRGRAEGLWLPFALSGMKLDAWGRFSSSLEVLGRSNSALEPLQQRVASLTAALMAEHANGGMPPEFKIGAQVLPLRDAVAGDAGKSSLVVLLASALLALLGLSIIATMWLARIARRRTALALHVVLGAHMSDIVATVAYEIICLFVLAFFAALPLAYYLVGTIKLLGAQSLPRLAELSLDATAIGLLLLIMCATALVLTVLLMQRFKRFDIIEQLRGSGKGSVNGMQMLARRGILAAQLSLILVALGLGGMLLQDTGKRLLHDPGYAQTGASVLQIELPASLHSATSKSELEARLSQALIGGGYAKSLALVDMPPVSRALALFTVKEASGEAIAQMQVNGVGYAYLGGIGMRVLAGRLMTANDVQDANKVVVLGQQAARLIGKNQSGKNQSSINQSSINESVLGKKIVIDNEQFEVIGVVNDIYNAVQSQLGASLQAYVPFKHFDGVPTLTLMLFHDGEGPNKEKLSKTLSA